MSGNYYKGVRNRQYYSLVNSLNLNGWGAGLNMYVEPTFHYLDRTYHTVYQVEASIYKTFLHNNLQLSASFIPLGNRRKLTRITENEMINLKYTTPAQKASIKIVWYFSGGNKDINVDVKTPSLNYIESKDNL